MNAHYTKAWPAIAVAGLIITTPALGSGFAIIEQSASGMGTAFAGSGSSALDASTVYFNPAGMTRLGEGNHYVLAGHAIMPSAEFDNRGSHAMLGGPLTGPDDDGGETAFVPNAYLVTSIDPDWSFGIGLNAPFELATEYDRDWAGRYHAVESSVMSFNINPSLAVQATDKLSLGFGLNVQYIDVKLTSAVDFGSLCVLQEMGGLVPGGTCSATQLAPQSADGFADISGDSWNFGWNAGLLYELNASTRVGLAYRGNVKHDVEGDADFDVPAAAAFMTQGGMFTDTGAEATVELPESVTMSVHHDYSDRLALMADAAWTRWSRFDELRIDYTDSPQPDSVTTENWDDT